MLPTPKRPKTLRPRRSHWATARMLTLERDTWACQIHLFAPLFICLELDPPGLFRAGIVVDHIIPERFIRHLKIGDPHHLSNLLTLCKNCHSRKTPLEPRLFAGDALTFLQNLRELGYPLERVRAAFLHFRLLPVHKLTF